MVKNGGWKHRLREKWVKEMGRQFTHIHTHAYTLTLEDGQKTQEKFSALVGTREI